MSEVKEEKMRQIEEEVLALTSSPLYAYRTENNYFPVIGEGSHSADIMFVGEAPGRNEAKTGRPFCGAAGKILDELLASVNIPREDIYITNIVKDRPPQNRDPLPEEIASYGPFLDRQIEIIQPKVIATLGRYSMIYIMQKLGLEDRLDTIGTLHGQAYPAQTSYGEVTILPLYHPASAIYNPSLKDILLKDFANLASYVK